jgi:hypothetical protein
MGNRLSKIYTKTGDDGRRYLLPQTRASCAICSDSGESRGIRRCPPDASRRPRAGILPASSCR